MPTGPPPKCTVDYICPPDWCHATRDVASASELPGATELPCRSVTMSIPFSSEPIVRIRGEGRLLVRLAGAPPTPDIILLTAVQNVASL